MKKALYSILLILLIAGVFLAGSWYGQRGVINLPTPGASEIVHHVDSTHPAHMSEMLRIPPTSAMSPEAVEAQGEAAESGGNPASVSLGVVNISPEKQQLIGVKVSPVDKTSGTHVLRLLGRVAPDETRVYRLNAGIQGFICEVSEVTTGDRVKKDQVLAMFSAPDSVAAIQNYIFVLNSMDYLKKTGTEGPAQAQIAASSSNFQQRILKLQDLGVSAIQMEEIKRTREVPERIKILAPADGFVLTRNISPGLKFERGAEWYQIGDLSRIWILADVFENEAQYLQPGQTVKVSLPQQRRTFQAKMSTVRPLFDPSTRTLKVRLEAENPEAILRPDMFVDVELPVKLPRAITVPTDAVLDSGLRKTVFVDQGHGFFEPREVETGWRIGDRVEIVSGLKPGEKIAISGNFLIDSESRMELAAAGMVGTLTKDPVCGVDVSVSKAEKAGRKVSYQGKDYYFSSNECEEQFTKNPDRYVKR